MKYLLFIDDSTYVCCYVMLSSVKRVIIIYDVTYVGSSAASRGLNQAIGHVFI